MNQTVDIISIADYLLRRHSATGSAGLYDGKAGLALSLFVASRTLQDEKMEDIAFDLIKESLVTCQNNPDFEKGTTGVGYALIYLIENNYLDADFDEIFGKQYEQTVRSFSEIEKEPVGLINSLKGIYFFSKAARVKNDDRMREIVNKIFEGSEFFFTIQFQDFNDINYLNKKAEILKTYTTYLKLVDYAGYDRFSPSLLDGYSLLYRKGKIASSLETGYYLKMLTEKQGIEGYGDVINDNIIYGMKNLYPGTLSMKERIDSAILVDKIKNRGEMAFANTTCPDVVGENDKIEDLLELVDPNNNPIGYGAGLARLLIYKANNNMELI